MDRDEPERQKDEFLLIMAARPFYHLQHLIVYLSHLPSILSTARWKLYIKEATATLLPWWLSQQLVRLGAEASTMGQQADD